MATTAHFWDDEVYAEFYKVSSAERSIVNEVTLGNCWRPVRAELDKFQGCFAAWSVGRGTLKHTDFRPFLAELGIQLTPAQARSLWQDLAKEGAKDLTYEQALLAYCKVKEAPVAFRACRGAAPPGHPLEELPCMAQDLQLELDEMLPERRLKPQARSLGPGLPLAEACDFLAAEGVLHSRDELRRYCEEGAVPQAVLFALLEELPGGASAEMGT
ncbi:unnamed protein product [Effrenium voratum]|nr:unnamed protein product [Effrenium voratum]